MRRLRTKPGYRIKRTPAERARMRRLAIQGLTKSISKEKDPLKKKMYRLKLEQLKITDANQRKKRNFSDKETKGFKEYKFKGTNSKFKLDYIGGQGIYHYSEGSISQSVIKKWSN